MNNIVKHINNTNASYRTLGSGDAKNTDLFLDNDQYEFFREYGDVITVRYNKTNLAQAILFIASILPRKFDQSATHKVVEYSNEFVLEQLAIIDALFQEQGRPVDTFTQNWSIRKDVSKKNGKLDNRFYFNGLLKEVSFYDNSGAPQSAKFTIRNYLAGEYSDIKIEKADDGIFDVSITNALIPNYGSKQKETSGSNLDEYNKFIAAIKTKPFLLLAGISGTGKSKIVRDMARACWPEGNENRKKQEPDNFMMIPVRPNWHDSTELIGYVSNIPSPRYVAGPFLRAIVKAWEKTEEFSEDGKTMPYFVCLDEMNLAPVEQYFAEYLSVIESRTGSGRDITTDVMLKEAEDWYLDLCNKLTEKSPLALREKLLREGISIPPNLIVCGTVNMDETTYAFSRKVLDRAMTIEMNEVELKAGLGEAEESFPGIAPESLLADRIRPEAYYDVGECLETIEEVLDWLGKINEKLEVTPFKIAYRTRNEILLYVIHSEELGVGRKEAFDEAVNMKILPRIEGDQKKVDTVLDDLREVLKEDVGIVDENSSPSLTKLALMDDRLKKQYYCTYWN